MTIVHSLTGEKINLEFGKYYEYNKEDSILTGIKFIEKDHDGWYIFEKKENLNNKSYDNKVYWRFLPKTPEQNIMFIPIDNQHNKDESDDTDDNNEIIDYSTLIKQNLYNTHTIQTRREEPYVEIILINKSNNKSKL